MVRVLAAGLGVLALGGCTAMILSEPVSYGDGEAIPAAYRPPAGACRIWYANRSPSAQPPIGDCALLQGQVPPGARLVRGS